MNTLLLLGALLFSTSTIASTTPNIEVKQEYTLEEIKGLISQYSKKYGVSERQMLGTINCESGFNSKAVNWNDHHALSNGSHGIGQFSRETFTNYSKQIGILNGDPYNPKQAIETMSFMFSLKQQGQWSCWKQLYSSDG
jgi:soluble lytic murein transglycosylase-like protein